MSNILKVTTPVGGYDNTNQIKPGPIRTTDPTIQGQINPDKVMKPDGRTDPGSQEQNVASKFHYESNYEAFMQQTKMLPHMTKEFSKLFFERFATLAESGLNDNFAEKVSKFINMVSVDNKDVNALLQQQGNASVKFSGPIFELLRQAMEQSSSLELKSGILEFLRRYVDMAENHHLMENIHTTLTKAENFLYKSGREELKELVSLMDFSNTTSETSSNKNLAILKEKILPFFNKNITKQNERGPLREITTSLFGYMARVENGAMPRVIEAFEAVLKFQTSQKIFGDLDPNYLIETLKNSSFQEATAGQTWMDGLIDVLRSGMEGEAGIENKNVFKNLLQAIILNESVYMPVLHFILPLQMNGRAMFAEMWIDPDAEKEKREGKAKTVQGLVKFDIEDLGFFDVFFIYKNDKIRIQMNCPDALEKDIAIINKDIREILFQNGIAVEEMFIEADEKSIPISTAFPKIFERKNAVNVSI